MNSSKVGETLSFRLRTLASYYHQTKEIWDIGCDHGLLGLSFVGSPEVQEIHLVDPSGPVIDKLTTLIDTHIPKGHSLIKIEHKKGQEVQFETSFSKTIFIAGMGGKEILEIVQHLVGQMTSKDRLIVSPHRKIHELRHYLSNSKLKLFEEQVIEEDGQFYQILVLEKNLNLPNVSGFGQQLWESATGRRYLEHQLHHVEPHQDVVSRSYLQFLQDKIAAK
jgi:tRNA (adenine22-N1)-methyltransferase